MVHGTLREELGPLEKMGREVVLRPDQARKVLQHIAGQLDNQKNNVGSRLSFAGITPGLLSAVEDLLKGETDR